MDVTIRIPAIEKLVDYAASGIGSIAGPMLMTWKASKDAEARRIAAKADAQILGILAGGQAEAMAIMSEAQQSARRQLTGPGVAAEVELTIAEAIEQRVRFQEERRQQNILGVVGQAAEELTVDEVEDREPNHDWTARFFNEAQDVSSEEMQVLWAKVLAGEVQRPGSTSIRTLGVLKDLDRTAATLFRTLCSVSVSVRASDGTVADMRVLGLGGNPGRNALKDHGLAFSSLDVLHEHGLITPNYDTTGDYRICIGMLIDGLPQIQRTPFAFQDRFWVLEPSAPRDLTQEFRTPALVLTRAGKELSRVVELEPQDKYGRDLSAFFAKHHLRMVEVASWHAQIVSPWPDSP